MAEKTHNTGITVLALDINLKEVFYDVTKFETDHGGATWVQIEGRTTKEKLKYPLIFFDKKFIKVSDSLIEIMFGKKENKSANEKQNP